MIWINLEGYNKCASFANRCIYPDLEIANPNQLFHLSWSLVFLSYFVFYFLDVYWFVDTKRVNDLSKIQFLCKYYLYPQIVKPCKKKHLFLSTLSPLHVDTLESNEIAWHKYSSENSFVTVSKYITTEVFLIKMMH